jgi:hypothetical protein
MMKPTTWGDAPEVQALAKIYNVNITVHVPAWAPEPVVYDAEADAAASAKKGLQALGGGRKKKAGSAHGSADGSADGSAHGSAHGSAPSSGSAKAGEEEEEKDGEAVEPVVTEASILEVMLEERKRSIAHKNQQDWYEKILK